jgi:hypothetical protein
MEVLLEERNDMTRKGWYAIRDFLSILVIIFYASIAVSTQTASVLKTDYQVLDKAVQVTLPSTIWDPQILSGWIDLYNREILVNLWDGTSLSGRSLARFILERHIPILWDAAHICSNGSCSIQHCYEDICTYEDGYPGVDPIYLDGSLHIPGQDLTGTLAHEIFHRTQPFGPVMDSQYEEYWAIYIETKITGAAWPTFTTVDPLNREHLTLWFAVNHLEHYFQLPSYPHNKTDQ